MNQKLFSPMTIGSFTLKNRMVMAPMTRNRAPEGIPTALMAEYYRHLASIAMRRLKAGKL